MFVITLNQCILKKSSILDKHAKMFVTYTADCEYELDFRTKDKDKPFGVATIYHPTQVKNHNEIRNFENDGYNFYKIDKLKIITYNSIRKLKQIFYRNHVPKLMLMTRFFTID